MLTNYKSSLHVSTNSKGTFIHKILYHEINKLAFLENHENFTYEILYVYSTYSPQTVQYNYFAHMHNILIPIDYVHIPDEQFHPSPPLPDV